MYVVLTVKDKQDAAAATATPFRVNCTGPSLSIRYLYPPSAAGSLGNPSARGRGLRVCTTVGTPSVPNASITKRNTESIAMRPSWSC